MTEADDSAPADQLHAGTPGAQEKSRRPARIAAILVASWALMLAGCATRPLPRAERDGAQASVPANLELTPDATPRIEPIRAGGANKPYEALGRWYVPVLADLPMTESGLASWYGRKYHGRSTASGETYDMYAMTAAHPTMPLPSYARVRNPANGREVVVRVNDRGPFADGRVIGALRLTDQIRPESRETVEALRATGTLVVMVTGDAQAVADTVAGDLGIDRVFAGVRPEDKAATVAGLQADGRTVAMVGDGVNDAPALARADVGIAIGAGTDVAIGSAGVILASSDPRAVLSVIDLSRATYRKMQQNLWWAAGYNLIAVPLAAGVLAPAGFVLPMSVGAILMSASTVVVSLNAQLLRRLDLTPPGSETGQ